MKLTLIGLLLSAVSLTTLAGNRVDNFMLLDHEGKAQELYYQSDAKAIVMMVQGNGCPIVRNALTDYRALEQEFAAKGVRFFMINSNLQDNRQSIASEADEWGINVPVLDDSAQIIGNALGLTRTAEVLVIKPGSWEILYRGPLNDRLHYERQKDVASEHYVKDTLNEVLAGTTPAYREVDSLGCLVNFPQRDTELAANHYEQSIAPLLQRNCVGCHTEGGIAPWAMDSYAMIQGFAPMIREVVRTRRMPPWHADPEVGEFLGNHGLSDEDTQELITWIEAGAPRGDGEDPLAATKPEVAQWPLGKPDLILEVPPFEVPASGVVEYQFPAIPNPLDGDAWIVAATVLPGDTKVLHHLLMGSTSKDDWSTDEESVFENYIMGYAPGNESSHMPEGHAVMVPKGGNYTLQMHYTPYGKKSVDRTKVGLYFAKEQPEKLLRHQVALNPMLSIPAGASDHEEAAYFPFYEDATLFSLVPHAHYRGKASRFDLVYPDGRSELILSVPNYDFNWQRTYEFAQPLDIPAGSKLVHRTTYDNSRKNPGNPAPERVVPWGLQSTDEMLYGAITFSWKNEDARAPSHDPELFETAQMMGFLDKDMDGGLTREELPEWLRKPVGNKFRFLDKNDDEKLQLAEMNRLMIIVRKKQAEAVAGNE